MFYIVNETEKKFNLVKDDDGGINIVCGETKLLIMAIDRGCNGLEAVIDEKIKDVVVNPKRTTKIYPKVENEVALYDMANVPMVFTEKRGLEKSAYRYPKSVVIVVTDSKDGSVMRGAEESDNYVPVEKYSGDCDCENNVFIDFYCVSLSRWDDIKDISIVLPSGCSLKFGTFSYHREDGKETKINALIRYDKDGNEVKHSEKKKQAAKNGGNKKYNFKNKKDRKKAHADLVRSLPPIKTR